MKGSRKPAPECPTTVVGNSPGRRRRALSVMEMLVTTFSVDPSMLSAAGFGEEQLRDPQNPESSVNRRVQLLNIGPR